MLVKWALAFCWSHVRRAYYKIAQGGPMGIMALIAPWSAIKAGQPELCEALLRIQRLYRIEKDSRGGIPDDHADGQARLE